MTVGQLIDWIVLNREGKVFKDFSLNEIAAAVKAGIANKTLYYATNADGSISGMILAHPNYRRRVLFVTENMAMSLATLKLFAKRAKAEFPGWRIEAMRHNRHRRFNTEKLYRKLT